MRDKAFTAKAVYLAGFAFLCIFLWEYFPRWMRAACPCCNLDVGPLYAARLLAGLAIVFLFRYFWQITILRWAKGPHEIAPMLERERNARLVAIAASAVFAGLSYGYLKSSMRAACSCCDVGHSWPFQLVCWLAALMVGMIVNYFLGLAIGHRAKTPLR